MSETSAAAERLRELASAATPGEWDFHAMDDLHDDCAGWIGAPGPSTESGVYVAGLSNTTEGLSDGAYIAAMSPPVALAVADLLEAVAAHHGTLARFAPKVRRRAFAVARAVLNNDSAPR